jgi:hypothetical protein
VTPRAARLAAHELVEQLAPAAGHLVGRVHVGEAREPHRAQVAVGRVHDDLHRRREGLVRVALGRPGGRRAAGCLGGEPLVHEPVDEGEQRAQPVARGADAVLAHERRVEARHVGLDDALRHARGEEVQRGAGVHGAVAAERRGERGPARRYARTSSGSSTPVAAPASARRS